MLHKNMVQEKNYDLRLFEKQKKIYSQVFHVLYVFKSCQRNIDSDQIQS